VTSHHPDRAGSRRDPGHGQGFEVAPGRPFRDLELLGQGGRRHPPPGLEDKEGSHEAIGPHPLIMTLKLARR
jgi:hypothetical protein